MWASRFVCKCKLSVWQQTGTVLQPVIIDRFAFSWRFYVEELPNPTVSQSSSHISSSSSLWTSGAWFSSCRIWFLWEKRWRKEGINWQTDGRRQIENRLGSLAEAGRHKGWPINRHRWGLSPLGVLRVFQREFEVNVHLWWTQQIKPAPLGTCWKSMLCLAHFSERVFFAQLLDWQDGQNSFSNTSRKVCYTLHLTPTALILNSHYIWDGNCFPLWVIYIL